MDHLFKPNPNLGGVSAMDAMGLPELRSMPSEQLFVELQTNDGNNPVMHALLRLMEQKIGEARREFFSRPVVSVPFGASLDAQAAVTRLYPEIREFVFERNDAIPDSVFQTVRHMSVRKCLLQLLRPDSALVGDPYAHEILLDGINPLEHNFVFRTQVPMVNIAADKCTPGSVHYVVADLMYSKRSVEELLRYSTAAEVSETLIVTPYDPRMWKYFGGNQLDGAYVYEWSESATSASNYLNKPSLLPKDFFTSSKYQYWALYIQPYGSDVSIKFTRTQYMTLFAGKAAQDRFVETRAMRNGFAEVSFIGYDSTIDVGLLPEVQDLEMELAVPVGCVEVRPVIGNVVDEYIIPGRQMDLARNTPSYVRAGYYDKAIQAFYRVKLGRQLLPALMRSLHANSARLVYNGAILTVETMVDVETMCMVAEDIINSKSSAKKMFMAQEAKVRMPMNTGPMDYAMHLTKWAAIHAMQSTDLVEGAGQISTYINNVMRGGPLPTERATEVLAPLRYGDVDMTIDMQKEAYVDAIADYAEDTFISVPMPYEITREAIQVDRADLFTLRLRLKEFAAHPVGISEVQSVYDEIFPGNSLIDPTTAQLQSEQGDFKFTIDVQYFRASIPLMMSPLEGYTVIPSLLRTSIGADLMGSFRTLIRSLMKRNFNRSRPEAAGDRQNFVNQVVELVLREYGMPHALMLRTLYQSMPITVSREVIDLWAAKHPVSDVVAAATLLEMRDVNPANYMLMPKDIPKPALSTSAQGAVSVGQTVVFHSKDVIALTVGAFTVVVSRLLAMFPTSIRFAFGADEHTSGQWADQYLNIPGTYVEEIDVAKFDKSQDWACFELILYVMKKMGVEENLLAFWTKASYEANVFNASFQLVFQTMFGNRSGNGGTLAVNCIVLLFAFLHTFNDMNVIAFLIKGDDSVIVSRKPMLPVHEARLYEHWGFTMKRVGRKDVIQFCSSFFVKDMNNKYRLVRDLVRLIEKAGRALPVNKPAHYFLDYYTSFVDAALAYDDPVLVANLQVATTRVYGKSVDVQTLVGFVQYVASSSKTFLSVLYGLTDEQIADIRDIDDAMEIMTRTRSVRFVKGKDLISQKSSLKLTLMDKMKISSDWIFTI